MDLEQEAAAYTTGKQTQLNEALSESLRVMRLYLSDNLYTTKELEDIQYHLLMVKLLARHSAEKHGIK